MWAIEDEKAEKRTRRESEAEHEAAVGALHYAINVATYVNETEATETLTRLLDAGYDGTLISTESDGMVVFSLQVGEFEDLWTAQRTAETLDASYGYSSSVTVLRQDEP